MKKSHLLMFIIALAAFGVLLVLVSDASSNSLPRQDNQQDRRPGGPPPGPPGGPGGPGGWGGADIEHLAFDLGLTESQIGQIRALRDEARTASQPYEEQVRKAEEGIRTIVESGTFDEQAVRTLAASEASAQIELRVIGARTEAATLALLTDEQRATLAKMQQRPPRPPRDAGGFGR
jgi:Spy/CpxP family protein refolding chaperone